MAVDPSSRLDMFGPINEDTSASYRAVLVDECSVPIAGLSSLTLTLMDADTHTIINNRDRQPILDINGGAFDPLTGTLTVGLTPADNLLLDQSKFEERHILRFDYTYNSGQSRGHHAIVLVIRNLARLGV